MHSDSSFQRLVMALLRAQLWCDDDAYDGHDDDATITLLMVAGADVLRLIAVHGADKQLKPWDVQIHDITSAQKQHRQIAPRLGIWLIDGLLTRPLSFILISGNKASLLW